MSFLSEFLLAQMSLSVLSYVESGGVQGFLGLLQPAETKEVPRKKSCFHVISLKVTFFIIG